MTGPATVVLVLPHWFRDSSPSEGHLALRVRSGAFGQLLDQGRTVRARLTAPAGLGLETALCHLLGLADWSRRLSSGALLAAARETELPANTQVAVGQFVHLEDEVLAAWPSDQQPSLVEARRWLDAVAARIGQPRLLPEAHSDGWHLLAWEDSQSPFSDESRTWPLAALWGESLEDAYCRGPGSDRLHRWMDAACAALAGEPVDGLWIHGVGPAGLLAPSQPLPTALNAITRSPLQAGLCRLLGGTAEVLAAEDTPDLVALAANIAARLTSAPQGWTIVAPDGPPDRSAMGLWFVPPSQRASRAEAYEANLLAKLLVALQTASNDARLIVLLAPPDDADDRHPVEIPLLVWDRQAAQSGTQPAAAFASMIEGPNLPAWLVG